MSERRSRPTVARRQLRLKLKRARLDAGKTQQDVATSLDWSVSKVMRIESGATMVAISDLKALFTEYPSLGPDHDDLIELARQGKSTSAVTRFPDVLTKQFTSWLDHEASASGIRQYEPLIVPGVLQTDDYAMGIVKGLIDADEDQRDPRRIVAARRERIEPLIQHDGPTMWFIIDEAALRRAVGNEDGTGGYAPMIEQLEHLQRRNTVGRQALGQTIEPDRNPNISIQVAPFAMGSYRIMRGPFEIIELEGGEQEDQYMMYNETPDADIVIREQYDQIDKYITLFDTLRKSLPSASETQAIIQKIIDDLG